MELHDYQKLGVEFLRGEGRGLFLDMGLGKTATTLSALTPAHLPAVVVAPKRVVEHVWQPERDLWRPDLSMAVAMGGPAQRRDALDRRSDITVISRDNVADAIGGAYKTVVLDELSSFKDRSTTRWKNVRKLAAKANQTWGLTGTPEPNDLLDLWAQVYLLDNGQRLGTTLTGYRSRYFRPGAQLPNGTIIEWILRDEAEGKIHELLSDLCLYMSAEDKLDLPPVTYNTVNVELPAKVRKMYNDFKANLVLDLEILGGQVHSASNASMLSNRLSQMTAGFIYGDDMDGYFHQLHTAKLDALREIHESTSTPKLVFYRYKPEADMILKAFPKACKSINDRGAIKGFMEGSVPMLLAHPQSAAHGLNFQAHCRTVVWTSLTWSLEEWMQGNKRVARQGQKHPVVIHSLECEGTVDPLIADRLASKEFNQQKLLDHLRSPI